MTELFVMRDKISRFVKEYETWFLIIAKFIGMMFVFNCVNSQLGYFEESDGECIACADLFNYSGQLFSFYCCGCDRSTYDEIICADWYFGNCCDAYSVSDVFKVCAGTECGFAGGAGSYAV